MPRPVPRRRIPQIPGGGPEPARTSVTRLLLQVRSEVGTDGPDFPHPVSALLPAPKPALRPGLPVSAAGGDGGLPRPVGGTERRFKTHTPPPKRQGPQALGVEALGPGEWFLCGVLQQGSCRAVSLCVHCWYHQTLAQREGPVSSCSLKVSITG